ncbi:MAG TPA: LysM peptidoglycan-binding domain-containing protein [Pseudomonadales bacterium]|jgi:membrane-bound lytic murein transglycosylase D
MTATAPVVRFASTLRTLMFVILASLVGCQTNPIPEAAETAAAEPPPPVAVPPPVIEPTLTYELKPDLWRDIRERFELAHSLDQKRVQQELRWLRENPRYLHNLKPRMERFLAYIHGEVAARELPGELALLPIVESALDPYAFSHGGAAGLWQFIPATAKRFGLQRNWWYDGRRDPIAATQAALDYLEYLHLLFEDWHVAVAGYNAGEGNVRRAQRKAAPGATFWEMALPRETQMYVPRLLALAAVVTDPEAYGLTLPELSPDVPFVAVDTQGQFDLAKAADTLSMDLDALYDWNPALNQWSTPPDGPHRLMIPALEPALSQAALAAVPAGERVQWLRIKVADGDTLSEIAHRHRTDTATLRRVNNLTGSSIRAGQAMYIPKSDSAPSRSPRSRAQKGLEYAVQPGDSLWTISRAHGVSMTRIMKANHVGPKDLLKVGQTLTIPGAQRSTPAAGEDGREVIRTVRYGVRKGDSLARIAARFNVRVSEIAQWNQLDVDNYLQPGQSLKLHVNVAAGQ